MGGLKLENKDIKDLLLSESYITEEEAKKAEEFSKVNRVPFVNYFFKEGILSKDLLGQALAEYYEMPYADLNTYIPSKDLVLLIPEEIAKENHVVVFKKDKDGIIVATDSPKQEDLLKNLKEILKTKKVKLNFSLTEDIEGLFLNYRKKLQTRFTDIIEKEKRVAPQIFEEIINDALSYKASDVHLEPQEKEVVVRFRIDGVLHEAGRIPKKYYDNILNRIKVQAQLRIDEHLAAQDGSIRYEDEISGSVDLRVSIAPSLDGEKVVLRVLAHYIKNFTLSDIGLSEKHQELLSNAAKKPFGMILVAGPTGSGKTTSLYALLKNVASPEVNVTTIEDPVEYKITGITQIQVNTQTNLTFAKGLRTIARQDPDVILVGEIRDVETAEIAVNAALTGHLLFSTFHANDAATAIPRLLDMGTEPFLLGSTLEVVVAQRLVRKICDHCRVSIKVPISSLVKKVSSIKKYFKSNTATMYYGKGCSNCGDTGFKGRIAIFEFIVATPELRDLILTRPSTSEIWKVARKQGSTSLFEDGLEKVKNGITTIDELLRVAEPPSKN